MYQGTKIGVFRNRDRLYTWRLQYLLPWKRSISLVFSEIETGSTGGDYSLDTHSTQDSDVSTGHHKYTHDDSDSFQGYYYITYKIFMLFTEFKKKYYCHSCYLQKLTSVSLSDRLFLATRYQKYLPY